MIRGLALLLIFQSLGEVLTRTIHGVIPGPVIGMMLLFVFLVWRKHIAPSIAVAADSLLSHLAIFFIPAAVGVMLYLGTLVDAGAAWLLAIIFSTVGAIAVTALIMKQFGPPNASTGATSQPSSELNSRDNIP